MSTPRTEATPQEVTRSLGALLRHLGLQVIDLEGAVNQALNRPNVLNPELISELQAFDRIHQELMDLSRLAIALSGELDHPPLCAAQSARISDALRLSMTRALLSSEKAPPSSGVQQDIHLF